MKFNFDIPEESQEIFSEDANYFVENLHKKFDTKINTLLEERKKRQKSFDEGSLPDFLDDTKENKRIRMASEANTKGSS